jgi:hypothetical protein
MPLGPQDPTGMEDVCKGNVKGDCDDESKPDVDGGGFDDEWSVCEGEITTDWDVERSVCEGTDWDVERSVCEGTDWDVERSVCEGEVTTGWDVADWVKED